MRREESSSTHRRVCDEEVATKYTHHNNYFLPLETSCSRDNRGKTLPGKLGYNSSRNNINYGYNNNNNTNNNNNNNNNYGYNNNNNYGYNNNNNNNYGYNNNNNYINMYRQNHNKHHSHHNQQLPKSNNNNNNNNSLSGASEEELEEQLRKLRAAKKLEEFGVSVRSIDDGEKMKRMSRILLGAPGAMQLLSQTVDGKCHPLELRATPAPHSPRFDYRGPLHEKSRRIPVLPYGFLSREEIHRLGLCTPCFFHANLKKCKDHCEYGDDCHHCHLCSVDRARTVLYYVRGAFGIICHFASF